MGLLGTFDLFIVAALYAQGIERKTTVYFWWTT